MKDSYSRKYIERIIAGACCVLAFSLAGCEAPDPADMTASENRVNVEHNGETPAWLQERIDQAATPSPTQPKEIIVYSDESKYPYGVTPTPWYQDPVPTATPTPAVIINTPTPTEAPTTSTPSPTATPTPAATSTPTPTATPTSTPTPTPTKADGKKEYADAKEFEDALKKDQNQTGAIVTFTVRDYSDNDTLGYILGAGEKLNFVSDTKPQANVGDTISVEVKTIKVISSEYYITYEKRDPNKK